MINQAAKVHEAVVSMMASTSELVGSPANHQTQNNAVWYCLIPGFTLYFHAMRIDGLYYAILYANLIITPVLFYIYRKSLHRDQLRCAIKILLPLGILLVLDLASGNAEVKQARQFMAYSFLAIGFLFVAPYEKWSVSQKQRLYWLVVLFILSYSLVQGGSIWYLNKPYGTAKNPHYLAQYCVLLILVSYYLSKYSANIVKSALLLMSVILFVILLKNGSRLGVFSIASSLLFYAIITHEDFKPKYFYGFVVVLLVGGLIAYKSDIGNMQTQYNMDLVANKINDRLGIWFDTISAQKNSSVMEWVVGHGLSSFREDFREFNRSSIGYYAPHNHILEILYASGIVGLLVVIYAIRVLFLKLFEFGGNGSPSSYAALLISALIANMLFAFMTISAFRSYSLLIIFTICGLLVLSLNADRHLR